MGFGVIAEGFKGILKMLKVIIKLIMPLLKLDIKNGYFDDELSQIAEQLTL